MTCAPQLGDHLLDAPVKLALAEIAAAAVVAQVIRVVKFRGYDNMMGDADKSREPDGVGQLGARHAGAVSGYGQCPVAEGQKSSLGDDGAVDAAAQGNGHRAVTAQNLQQAVVFGRQRGRQGGSCRLGHGDILIISGCPTSYKTGLLDLKLLASLRAGAYHRLD